MTRLAFGFALVLSCSGLCGCEDADDFPNEPQRMDSGLQQPNRDSGAGDATTDSSTDTDAGDTDAGDEDAGN